MRSTHPFGTLLGKLRARKKGLTQSKLAEMTGYDPAVITRMCQGKQDLTGPQARERVIHVIVALDKCGVLNGAEEANALLGAASLPPLFAGKYVEAELLQQLALHSRAATDKDSSATHAPRSTRSLIQIRIASVLVDDQDKALKFYTEKLGFAKKMDMQDGDTPMRYLTVVSPNGIEGVELELQAAYLPSAVAWQKDQYELGFAFTMLYTDNINTEFNCLKQKGVVFHGEPYDGGPVFTVKFEDTCGNLINLIQQKA
jgi:catechol 2,3-dioxygenase-like lactoylglutathione lyase family enzyme